MPLTTQNARASALLIGLPFGRVFPLADGVIDQADRQHSVLSYAGLLAGEPVGGRIAIFGTWTLTPAVRGLWTLNEP